MILHLTVGPLKLILEELLERKLPGFLRNLGRDFAGVKGSRVYNALLEGSLSYRSYCFRRP